MVHGNPAKIWKKEEKDLAGYRRFLACNKKTGESISARILSDSQNERHLETGKIGQQFENKKEKL